MVLVVVLVVVLVLTLSLRSLVLPYGSGVVLGDIVSDTITMGGIPIKNQLFGEVTVEPGTIWTESPFDGILGLAFPVISLPIGVTPPFDNMYAQGQIGKYAFSFYLSTSNGRADTGQSALVLGGADPKYIKAGESFKYHKLDVAQALLGYWLIKGSDIRANGVSLKLCKLNNCQFVVDTGTSIIVGPSNRVQPLIDLVNKTGTIAADGTMDCALEKSFPILTFVIDGHPYTLEPSFYVLKSLTDSHKIECQLGIQGINPLLSGELWILGDPFLRKYYSLFDRKEKRVGFALAKQ